MYGSRNRINLDCEAMHTIRTRLLYIEHYTVSFLYICGTLHLQLPPLANVRSSTNCTISNNCHIDKPLLPNINTNTEPNPYFTGGNTVQNAACSGESGV